MERRGQFCFSSRAPRCNTRGRAAALLAALLLFAHPAQAQTDGASGPVVAPSESGAAEPQRTGGGFETLPASDILIVSMDQIYRESAAGRAIETAKEQLTMAAEAELLARRDALSEQERLLSEERDNLEAAERERREERFRADVADLRKFRRERGAAIQRAVQRAKADLTKILNQVLISIMRERRAAIMMDKRSAVLSSTALDITAEAIRRLDVAAPSIEVRIDEQADGQLEERGDEE